MSSTKPYPHSNKLLRSDFAQMFEHMKNYQQLLKKVSTWLRPKCEKDASLTQNDCSEEVDESLLFVHIFCHRTMPYHFVQDDGWMAKNFFSGA